MLIRELMNEYGSCDTCKHFVNHRLGSQLCTLWEIVLDEAKSFNCAAWEEKK